VDRLEADGLVKRVSDPTDRRSVRASLTPLGVDRQASGAKQLAAVKAGVAKSLSSEDRESLARILASLR
jgi:DNA-binding MarR family transcriptional regulator